MSKAANILLGVRKKLNEENAVNNTKAPIIYGRELRNKMIDIEIISEKGNTNDMSNIEIDENIIENFNIGIYNYDGKKVKSILLGQATRQGFYKVRVIGSVIIKKVNTEYLLCTRLIETKEITSKTILKKLNMNESEVEIYL